MGEMSRLAVLSSKFDHYKDALRTLCALYIARGYPRNLVVSWMRGSITDRWTKRFNDRSNADNTHDANVLVLKTEYNLTWNYFNATELGNVIFNYWREWLARADTGNFNAEYPPPPPAEDFVPSLDDVRKTNIFSYRVITSRKRTQNLLDLANLWKKTVLEQLDERVLDDYFVALPDEGTSTGPRTAATASNAIPLGDRRRLTDFVRTSLATATVDEHLLVRNETRGAVDEDSGVELQPARYRDRSPAAPSGWNNASMSGSMRRM
jgi:hypothetical protein